MLPRASLRAQDRSRGAPPATQPIARPTTQPTPKNLHPSTKRKPKRPIPKDQQIATHHARTGGSGIGPERALEAITHTPRAQRESPCSRELPCEHRTDPAEPHPRLSPSPDLQHNPLPKTSNQSATTETQASAQKRTGKLPPTTHAPAAAGSGRSEHWKRSPSSLARSAKAHAPASFPASAGPIPQSPTHDSALSPDPQRNRHPKTSNHYQSVTPSVRSQKTSR